MYVCIRLNILSHRSRDLKDLRSVIAGFEFHADHRVCVFVYACVCTQVSFVLIMHHIFW